MRNWWRETSIWFALALYYGLLNCRLSSSSGASKEENEASGFRGLRYHLLYHSIRGWGLFPSLFQSWPCLRVDISIAFGLGWKCRNVLEMFPIQERDQELYQQCFKWFQPIISISVAPNLRLVHNTRIHNPHDDNNGQWAMSNGHGWHGYLAWPRKL